MIQITEFIKAGGGLTDSQLSSMIRKRMQAVPSGDRQNWMRQVELSLDGYGGGPQLLAAEKVKSALAQLEREVVAGPPSAP